jgi:SseB protein N-terminal domain
MNALEESIIQAFASDGGAKEANKAYVEFIKANFMMPVDKEHYDPQQPKPLFAVDEGEVYIPVFSNQNSFDLWANDIQDEILIFRLSGVDLLKGIADDVSICLDINSASYKVFNPQEIARMRSIIIKFFGGA